MPCTTQAIFYLVIWIFHVKTCVVFTKLWKPQKFSPLKLHTHTDTDMQIHIHTDRQTHTHIQTQTHTYTHPLIQTHIHTQVSIAMFNYNKSTWLCKMYDQLNMCISLERLLHCSCGLVTYSICIVARWLLLLQLNFSNIIHACLILFILLRSYFKQIRI